MSKWITPLSHLYHCNVECSININEYVMPYPLHAAPWRQVLPPSSVMLISKAGIEDLSLFTHSTKPFKAAT